nr:hypothetical protein [uncultured Cohaesibacter sp.]
MANKRNTDFDRIFSSLVKSGFEFVTKAIDEFESSPKFSTIHFATAVELFLKARLMKEHWSLIVDKTDQPDRQKFLAGNFKSITPSNAIERMNRVLGSPLSESAKSAFVAIANHRNKMIHFIHEDTDGQSLSADAKDKIVTEQLRGWWELHQLLTVDWKRDFFEFEELTRNASFKMERHRKFLERKFQERKSDIAEYRKKGLEIRDCPSCGFKALKFEECTPQLLHTECVVCRHSGNVARFDCPDEDCDATIEISDPVDLLTACPKCGLNIDQSVLQDQLDTEPTTSDNYFDRSPINCPYCSGYQTVVHHYDGYLCCNCLEYSEEVGYCGWCSDGQLGGVPEHSELVGCEFCDGRIGWDSD